VYFQLCRVVGEFAQWSRNDYGCHSYVPSSPPAGGELGFVLLVIEICLPPDSASRRRATEVGLLIFDSFASCRALLSPFCFWPFAFVFPLAYYHISTLSHCDQVVILFLKLPVVI
jgi:hypothetical protein